MMSDDGFSSIPSLLTGFVREPNPNANPNSNPNTNPAKRKRNLPGTPDPDAEVIALSPKSLVATNRFVCDMCNKGFQRDQNLQLHRRGHNLPWKLKQRTSKEVRKKVYVCPEKSCVHHEPSRALGDLTGIKKHFSRKHGVKKWKCEKCSKKYAVQSDWKAHSKICGTREYKCDCGTIFSRKDSFTTHRAFCDALAEESARFSSLPAPNVNFGTGFINETSSNLQVAVNPHLEAAFRPDLVGLEVGQLNMDEQKPRVTLWAPDHGNSINAYLSSNSTGLPDQLIQTAPTNMFGLSAAKTQWLNSGQDSSMAGSNLSLPALPRILKEEEDQNHQANLSAENITSSLYYNDHQNQRETSGHLSATALLQKAAQMGSTRSNSALFGNGFGFVSSSPLSNSFNSYNQSRNEAHKLMMKQPNQGQNLTELMNSVSASSNGDDGFFLGDRMNSLSSSVMVRTRNLDPLTVMPTNNGKQKKPNCSEVERSMTRDFLGVGGGDHGGRPFLQQELAKFASMGVDAAIDLTHHRYSGSH